MTGTGTKMPRRVGEELPEPERRKNGPSTVTLNRAKAIRDDPGIWYEWPTKTAPAMLRKTLATALAFIGGGGAFEVENRGGRSYAKFTAPALGTGETSGAATTGQLAAAVDARPKVGDVRAPAARTNGAVQAHRDREERSRIAAAARTAPTATEHTSRASDGVVTIVEDDDSVHHSDGMPPFRPLGPAREVEVDEDAPVVDTAWAPKVKCPTCREYLVIGEKSDRDKTLAAHYDENRSCKTAQKRTG